MRGRVRLAVVLCTLLPACSLVGLPGSNVAGCYARARGRAATTPVAALTRFVAMGDFGTAEGGRNRQVATALAQFIASTDVPVERVFALGDNFYYNGLIGPGAWCWNLPAPPSAVSAQALSVLEPFEFLRDRGIPLTGIPGNHDYGCGAQGVANQEDIDRWLPAAHRWGDQWRILSGQPQELVLGNGSVQLIVIDSERMITDRAFRRASAERLTRLLVEGRDRFRWRLIATHHPLQTYGAHDGAWWEGAVPMVVSFLFLPSHALAALQVPPFTLLNQQAYAMRYVHYREAVEDAIRRSGVAVALTVAGHDHQLQLLAPEAAGLPFTAVSGSAAKCTPTRAGEDTLFAASKYGFAVVTAYADHLELESIGTTGCDTEAACTENTDAAPYRLYTHRIERVGDGAPAPEDTVALPN